MSYRLSEFRIRLCVFNIVYCMLSAPAPT
jgi:hypothetical protein